MSLEGTNTNFVVTSGYTIFSAKAFTSGGTANSNIGSMGEWDIALGSTTSNPTTSNSDQASAICALLESVPSSATIPGWYGPCGWF